MHTICKTLTNIFTYNKVDDGYFTMFEFCFSLQICGKMSSLP